MKRPPASAFDIAAAEHRRLERYLFRFARDKTGQFTATPTPKLAASVMTQPGVTDGWSIKDVLAALVIWEQALLSWYDAQRRGVTRKGLPTGLSGSAVDPPDTRAFARLRRKVLNDVLRAFQRSHQQLLRTFQSKAGRGAMGEIIALHLATRYRRAKAQIRSWVKRRTGVTTKAQRDLR